MRIEFTREEVRQLHQLWQAATGRFPEAFYTAGEKLEAALNAPAPLLNPPTPPDGEALPELRRVDALIAKIDEHLAAASGRPRQPDPST